MIACIQSLCVVNLSINMRRIAALILEAIESDKLEELSTKIEALHLRYSYAMEAAHWVYLLTVTDRPCA